MEIDINKEKKLIYVINIDPFKKVMSYSKISSGAKLVLRNLIDRLGRKNFCFPSQKLIGKDLGLSERQVRKHIKVLRHHNIISVKRRYSVNQKSNKHIYSNYYDLSKILKPKYIEVKGTVVPESRKEL